MKSDDEWVNFVKRTIRAEMTRRGITYEQLSERLAELGAKDTPVSGVRIAAALRHGESVPTARPSTPEPPPYSWASLGNLGVHPACAVDA